MEVLLSVKNKHQLLKYFNLHKCSLHIMCIMHGCSVAAEVHARSQQTRTNVAISHR